MNNAMSFNFFILITMPFSKSGDFALGSNQPVKDLSFTLFKYVLTHASIKELIMVNNNVKD